MHVHRKILPVGQGAFYVERHYGDNDNNVNLVYDCGSTTGVRFVKREIENEFIKDKTIHAVFISHLDKDHINGVEYLLKHREKWKVERIFFPLITSEAKIRASIGKLLLKNSQSLFVYNFIHNPRQTLNDLGADETQLIEVLPYEGEESRSREEYRTDDNQSPNIERINSGWDVSGKIRTQWEWELVPFNFDFTERNKQLEEKLKDIGLLDNEIEEFRNGIADSNFETLENRLKKSKFNSKFELMKEFKKIYKKIEGDINQNSMTLFSGVRCNSLRQCIKYPCHCLYHFDCLFSRTFLNGCLYTGDYNAWQAKKRPEYFRFDELDKAYKDYWDYIGLIQVPHHGAEGNYNKGLRNKNCDVFFASAGQCNRHLHPHAPVRNDLQDNDKHFYVVTEYPNTAFETCIY